MLAAIPATTDAPLIGAPSAGRHGGGGIHPDLCERAWTCPNMDSVVMQKRYALPLRRRHMRETVREGFEPSGDKDSTKVVFFACSGVFPARHLLRTAGMAESLF